MRTRITSGHWSHMRHRWNSNKFQKVSNLNKNHPYESVGVVVNTVLREWDNSLPRVKERISKATTSKTASELGILVEQTLVELLVVFSILQATIMMLLLMNMV